MEHVRRPDVPAERLAGGLSLEDGGDFFDLDALKLEADSGDVQPRYRVDLNVQATDANFDTGPRTAVNADPIRLLVVSSGDLLVEIGKEEEVLGAKLDERCQARLCRDNYAFVNSKTPDPPAG